MAYSRSTDVKKALKTLDLLVFIVIFEGSIKCSNMIFRGSRPSGLFEFELQ